MAVNTQRVTLRLSKTDIQKFESIAQERGVSRHAVIKECVIAQLKSGDFSVSKVKTPGTG